MHKGRARQLKVQLRKRQARKVEERRGKKLRVVMMRLEKAMECEA